MTSFLNNFSQKWFAYIADSSIQMIFFFVIILIIAIIFKNRSAKFLYGLWTLILLKAIIPPSVPLPFQKQIDFIPNISWAPPESTVSQIAAPVLRLEFTGYIFLFWIGIVFILLAYVLWKNIIFRHKLRGAVPFDIKLLSPAIKNILDKNRPVKIFMLDNICAPFIINIFKPKIFLPEDALNWEKKKLEAILSHELAHIQRKDLWLNFCQNFIQIFYFFNPLVWIANRQLTSLRERACDDYAIVNLKGYSLEYSKFLLAHLDRSMTARECPALVNYFLRSKKTVLKRFEYLMKKKEGTMLKLKRVEKILLTVLCFAALGFTLANSGISEVIPQNIPEQTQARYGEISGQITDKISGEPIPGANVFLAGTNLGTASEISGKFVIKNVPPGKYTVQVSMLGFKKFSTSIRVEVKKTDLTKYDKSFQLEKTSLVLDPLIISDLPLLPEVEIVTETGQIQGKVTDKKTGEPIAGVHIFLQGTNLGTVSSQTGEFTIKNVPPGLYNVKINMIGYNSATIESVRVVVKLWTTVNFNLERTTLEVNRQQWVYENKFVPYDKAPEPIGGQAELQRLLQYPEIARRAGVEGTVVIYVLIDQDGNVAETRIARSLGNNGCDEAAVAAIKKTQWKSAIYEDEPVEVWVSIPVIFRLPTIQLLNLKEKNEKINRSSDPQSETPMFVPYDTAPEPIGGQAAMQKHLKYPEIARRTGVEGTVIIQVLIDTEGKVVETRVARSLGPNGCDEAASKAIKSASWKPALQREKPVQVWVSIPVIFKLKEDKEVSKEKTSKAKSEQQNEESIEKQVENYPNPFNPSTRIKYFVEKQNNVVINIFNISGQIVRTLVDETRPPGNYIVNWDGTDKNSNKVPSGQYFYQVKIGNKIITKKMLKIK